MEYFGVRAWAFPNVREEGRAALVALPRSSPGKTVGCLSKLLWFGVSAPSLGTLSGTVGFSRPLPRHLSPAETLRRPYLLAG